jgi:hypothetical protein
MGILTLSTLMILAYYILLVQYRNLTLEDVTHNAAAVSYCNINRKRNKTTSTDNVTVSLLQSSHKIRLQPFYLSSEYFYDGAVAECGRCMLTTVTSKNESSRRYTELNTS